MATAASMLRVYGRPIVASVDYGGDNDDDEIGRYYGERLGAGGGQSQRAVVRKKPMEVHSPRLRTGWQRDAAMANYDKARSTTIKDNFDYSREKAYQPSRPEPRGAGGDSRFADNRARHFGSDMRRVLRPDTDQAYQQPSANPKCPTDASLEFCRRNQKGTFGFNEPPRSQYQPDDEVHVRCPSEAARANLDRGRGQAGQVIFESEGRGCSSPTPNPRVGAGSLENCERARGAGMSGVFDQQCNIRSRVSDAVPAGRVVRGGAAEENARRNRGQSAQIFGVGRDTRPDPQPAARVRPEAADTAAKEGAGMRDTLFGGGQPDPQPAPRVRLGGGEVANRSRGCLQQEQQSYGRLPPDPPPQPKVRPEAQEYQQRERAVVTRNLLQKYGQLPGDCPPKPHVPPQARNTAYRAKGGAMKDCINPSRPKRRRNRRHRPATAAY